MIANQLQALIINVFKTNYAARDRKARTAKLYPSGISNNFWYMQTLLSTKKDHIIHIQFCVVLLIYLTCFQTTLLCKRDWVTACYYACLYYLQHKPSKRNG